MIVGSPRCGAAAHASANFEENSPNTRCWLRSRTSPKVATSQNAVEPPLPSTISQPSGSWNRSVSFGANVADQVLHGRLAVRCAEDRALRGDQRLDLLVAHLGRATSEASVGRQQIGGDRDGRQRRRQWSRSPSMAESASDATAISPPPVTAMSERSDIRSVRSSRRRSGAAMSEPPPFGPFAHRSGCAATGNLVGSGGSLWQAWGL